MLFIFLLMVFPLFCFLIIHQQRNYTGQISLLPPAPPSIPLIGNLHQLDNSSLPVYLCNSLKPMALSCMSLRLGFRKTIVISLAKMAKEVMKTQDLDFCNRPNLLGQQKLSYNGLDLVFSPFNSYYKEIRKICVLQLFSANKAELLRPIREDEVSKMIGKISKSTATSKPINLSKVMMCLTSSIICRVGFGKRYEGEGSEISRFYGLLGETQAMFTTFFFSDYFPLMRWVDRLTGGLSRLEKVFKELDAFYQQLIDDHLDPKRQKPEQEDIIDVFLKIMKDPKSTFISLLITSKPSSWGSLLYFQNVFVAGTETGANTVVWAMTFLMKYPAAMKKVQDEVRNLIGKKGFLNEDEIQDLPYLKAVVKETFRLQSTVPLLVPRETIQDCNIGGYKIPAKTLVYVNAWAIGRDTEAWGQNSEDFYPERLIGSSIDYKGQEFGLIRFGSGRRICPGMYMGAATVELALANLLYRFDWKMPSGIKKEDLDFDTAPGSTMHKRNPLYLLAAEYRS
ncbi:hypothetical protein SLEP1_g49562 [Rubroshorea leprosula]|uniref:Cytochrome P450 n=1 Tax=Rubroshorea leprosula TaxID=152421 RepID=A0AAV5LY08_9ROSI|nr:hypothetical protein SLEP1_g49562 [Rubroshorea leprosula]